MKLFHIISGLIIFVFSVSGAFADDRADLIAMEMDRLQVGQSGALDLGWGRADDFSVSGFDREQRIGQALTRAASGGIKTKNICWEDVCAISSKSSNNYGQAGSRYSVSSSSQQPDSFYERFFDFRRQENSIEIGAEWFDYTYREEAFMKLDGSMKGLYADYRHRFGQNKAVNTWKEVWGMPNNFNVLMVQARFSYGDDIKYRSSGTGESFNEKHYAFESRVLLGYDIPLRSDFLITPYFGLGYRYLLDDNGGTQSTTGAWAYDRESRYYYLPLGVDVVRFLENAWSIGLNLEYDFFISGRQDSHLEDVPGYSETLRNKQDSGYGMRSSIKAVKELDRVDFVIEPFARYWHIKDSDIRCTVDICGLEPKNRTWEFGVKAGVRF